MTEGPIRGWLRIGADVRLELADGSVVGGTVVHVDAGSVRLEGVDEPVRLDAIADVIVEFRTGGVE